MVNAMLDAITVQLAKTFGGSYRYYVENVEQNLTKPCFTIDTLLPTQRARSPVLYDRTVPIVIHYFTEDMENTKKDCYAMAEQLIACLEYLPFKTTILRGEDISWHMVDDVLQLFITYRFTTKKVVSTEDSMSEMVETNISHI